MAPRIQPLLRRKGETWCNMHILPERQPRIGEVPQSPAHGQMPPHIGIVPFGYLPFIQRKRRLLLPVPKVQVCPQVLYLQPGLPAVFLLYKHAGSRGHKTPSSGQAVTGVHHQGQLPKAGSRTIPSIRQYLCSPLVPYHLLIFSVFIG